MWPPRRCRRHPVGPENGRALARPARGISAAGRPAGDDSGNGTTTARGWRCGARSSSSSTRGGAIRWEHTFIDGTFASAKKGALTSAKPSGARVRSAWWWSTARVFLWEYMSPRPAPAEVTLVDTTLKHHSGATRPPRYRQPVRLIADRAYDSDALRERLARRGITVIVPYRDNRAVRRYEDRRHLRRYRRRWVIERTFAWFGGFRRLLVRHERLTSMYLSLLYFAAALIALRRF